MNLIDNKWINKLTEITNGKSFFYSLLVFDVLFCIINIYKQISVLGALFLIVNLSFLILSKKKMMYYLLFFLYPLARVLKLPGISTSLLTVALGFSYLILIIRFFISKEKLNSNRLTVTILFFFYITLTLIVSIINKGFEWNALFSYYLYLAFPFTAFIFTNSFNDIDGTGSIIFCMLSYLLGTIITIVFYKLIPDGANMLSNIGVNVFDMGIAGIRFSPLTDDPNYGTALIVLISCVFIISKKTRKESFIGYPILIIALILSCFSISKMFIGCAFVLLLCLIILIMEKTNNLFVNSLIILVAVFGLIIFLSTPIGNSLIIRTIGTQGGVSLNRITSGRAGIFGEYSSYILSNPLVVLFGKGPLYIDKVTFTNGEHNTFTKNVFGSGVIGVSVILVAFYIMLKNRYDRVNRFPNNPFFYGFIICLFICFMSLGIAPSTVFPIFVVACQFSNFNPNNKRKIITVTEIAV